MKATALNLRVEELDRRIALSKAPAAFKTDWAIWRGLWAQAYRTSRDTMPVHKLDEMQQSFEGWRARVQQGIKDDSSQSSTTLTIAGALTLFAVGAVGYAALGDDDEDCGGETPE